MISLRVKMRDEFGQCSPQRPFSEQNQPREALLFDGAHPSFSVAIQIWAPRRNFKRLDPLGRQHIVESGTEFGIPVVQHVPTLPQRSGRVVDGIARHLSDPGLRWVTSDAGKRNAAGLQMKKEQHVVPSRGHARSELRR